MTLSPGFSAAPSVRFLAGATLRPRAVLVALSIALSLSAIQAHASTVLKLGTNGGPYEEIAQAAAAAGKREGLDIKPIVFDGVVRPNQAVADHDLDANAFQHIIYLNTDIKQHGYKLTSIANIYTMPLAIYSTRHKRLADIPVGGTFAVPADDSNQNRALLAMQDNGLIKLRRDLDTNTTNASVLDIVENPKHLKIIEISTPILASSLPDVDAGAVNANFAFQQAKLRLDQALAVENPTRTKQYSEIVAIRTEDLNKPWVQPLIQAFHSPEVRQVIESRYKNVMTPDF